MLIHCSSQFCNLVKKILKQLSLALALIVNKNITPFIILSFNSSLYAGMKAQGGPRDPPPIIRTPLVYSLKIKAIKHLLND